MGGLKKYMPLTFATYGTGMLALCGVPIFFSGFWSKDAILESAHGWPLSHAPYYMLVIGAVLTAFYMTRQVSYVFFGAYRGHGHAHESPKSMTMPLAILAFFAVALGAIGTPAWPWFRAFLDGHAAAFELSAFAEPAWLMLLLTSCVIVAVGIGVGWWLYGNKSPDADAPDVLEAAAPLPWKWLRDRLYVDEFYGMTVIAFYGWWARVADWLDRRVFGGVVAGVAWVFGLWARLNRFLDANVVDGTALTKAARSCRRAAGCCRACSRGACRRICGCWPLAVIVLAAILIWSSRA